MMCSFPLPSSPTTFLYRVEEAELFLPDWSLGWERMCTPLAQEAHDVAFKDHTPPQNDESRCWRQVGQPAGMNGACGWAQGNVLWDYTLKTMLKAVVFHSN